MQRTSGRDRLPLAPTRARLEARALYYLERFPTTAARLRQVLLRRALRDAERLELDPSEVRLTVEAVLARLIAAGLLDDRAFAVNRARRLTLAGRSPARIRAALTLKGLDDPSIATALREVAEELPDPELVAAMAYARRRKIGPWGLAAGRGERQAKDLAILARAGFSFRVARKLLEAETPDALEQPADAGFDS
ncbi:MAG: RecX family transcriptional regulator [Geminicoccaceae bacterium]